LFFVLKVLQELPEGLAVAVLAASPADLEDHLSILPPSLHPLAIEAAFPEIRRKHHLTLDFDSLENLTTAYAVLHAAIEGTTGASALKSLELYDIPVSCNDRLQQLISAACSSASDVLLEFCEREEQLVALSRPFLQLEECLSKNTALTSLQLLFEDDPWHVFAIDCLFQSLTGLQSLDLTARIRSSNELISHKFDTPSGIINLCCLTRLHLGPGFHLRELPQILPYMARLEDLFLCGDNLQKQGSMALSSLTSLKTLKLQFVRDSDVLPSVATLTMLQTLDLSGCRRLQRLPALEALTALQTLKLGDCRKVSQLPPLHNLTALKDLEGALGDLLRWPGFDTHTNLQTLELSGSENANQLPRLADFTSLQSLRIRSHPGLQEMPRLDALKNLQTLSFCECANLLVLPPLNMLTALQTLNLFACERLQQLPPLNCLKALCMINLARCYELQQLPPLDCLTNLQHLMLLHCTKLLGSRLKLPSTQASGVLVYGVADEELRVLQGEHLIE
jgi:hypothetical protein